MKRAVVLAGGGARGAYQVGVWRALREMGVEYHIVTGTSVGALNGALMVQGDYDLADEMWESITLRDVVDLPDISALGGWESGQVKDFVWETVRKGGLDVTPLEELLRQVVDEERLRASPVEFGLVTTHFPLIRPVQLCKEAIPPGEVVDYLLASATYFPFFRNKDIHGSQYVDGALADNLPISLAAACGAEEIIAVDLESVRGIAHRWHEELSVKYIHSYWSLGAELAFEPERARRNKRLGYLDALKVYHRLEGKAYAFYPGETRRNARRMLPCLRRVFQRSGYHVLEECEKVISSHAARRKLDGRYPSVWDTPGHNRGQLVTAAAELAGEVLGISPEEAYTFVEFNRKCLTIWNDRKMTHDSRDGMQLRLAYRMLEQGVRTGRLPEQLHKVSVLVPKTAVAAGYLMALEIAQAKERRGSL